MTQRCSRRARPKAGDSAAVSAFALIQPPAPAFPSAVARMPETPVRGGQQPITLALDDDADRVGRRDVVLAIRQVAVEFCAKDGSHSSGRFRLAEATTHGEILRATTNLSC